MKNIFKAVWNAGAILVKEMKRLWLYLDNVLKLLKKKDTALPVLGQFAYATGIAAVINVCMYMFVWMCIVFGSIMLSIPLIGTILYYPIIILFYIIVYLYKAFIIILGIMLIITAVLLVWYIILCIVEYIKVKKVK